MHREARQWVFLAREHAVDLAAIAALGAIHLATDDYLPVLRRPVWTDDRGLWHPYATRALVGSLGFFVVAYVVPLALVLCVAALRFPSRVTEAAGAAGAATPSPQELHADDAARAHWRKTTLLAIIGLSVTALLTCDVVIMVKALAGRPRPDFMARCNAPGLNAEDLRLGRRPADAPLLIDVGTCRGDASLVNEGLKSFPSGHSAATFAGCVFAALVVAQHSELFPSMRTQPCANGRSHWVLAATVPLIVAAYTAVSRYVDYRHHATDVLFGSLLGIASGTMGFRIYCAGVPNRAS